jgi:hypothetical protein
MLNISRISGSRSSDFEENYFPGRSAVWSDRNSAKFRKDDG